jgi:hypothetical protein
MRLLLDECVPRVLCADFPEHFCRTVSQMRWRGLTNGALLARAGEEFDVFITVDRNLRYQQNLKKLPIAIIVVHVQKNDYDLIRPFVPQILESLRRIAPRELVLIE